MAVHEKQMPTIIVVIIVIAILTSMVVVVLESNLIFKQEHFQKTITLDPSGADAGYINLKSNKNTPSALEWAKFDNGKTYVFFSVVKGQFVEEKVIFDVPETISGRYYVDFEIKYLSGKVEVGTITFYKR